MALDTNELIESASVVVLGNFNPSILHPDWFDRHGIMPADEIAGLFAEPVKKEIPELGATIEFSSQFIISQESAIINFKSFTLKVSRDRFEISCKNREKFKLMVTALRKIFMILNETPVSAYGVNFSEKIKTDKSKVEIYKELFPKTEKLIAIFGDDILSDHVIKVTKNKKRMSFSVIDRGDDALVFRVNNHFENEDTDIDFLSEDIVGNFDFALKDCETILFRICGKTAERIVT